MKIVISSESVTTLDVVGADGTADNTGCANGIISLLELQLIQTSPTSHLSTSFE